MRAISLLFAALLANLACSFAQEPPPPPAARSVHLGYPGPAGVAFYNEMTVEESTNGSYFMACGFNRGYFGIQQLGSADQKVVIFSIWDPTKGDDANAVPLEQRVEVLGAGEGVKVSRFGGEGTGAKSMWSYPWKLGETYRFLVRASTEDHTTTYVAHFYMPEQKEWQYLAAFRTRRSGQPLSGYYSFVEDFRRDGKSPHERRRARFGNGWLQQLDGHWMELRTAHFTADATKLDNIDAGVAAKDFYLATGGEVARSRELKTQFERPASGKSAPDPMREIDKPH